MISLADVYHVIVATVPLYVAMILAYVSVKWWKLFNMDQCSGINNFVAKFSVPLLSFQVISTSNPYEMNLKLICADLLQKLLAIIVLGVITKISFRGSLNWIITGLSLSTLPNTLILGIPLLRAMYGDEAVLLLAQIVVLQSTIWYNLLLLLFELNATREAYAIPTSEATAKDKGIAVPCVKLRYRSTHPLSYGWNVQLPKIVDISISILSDGGLGMAMFSLGLFTASRTSIIASGTWMTVLAMAMKFIVGPALMAASSTAIGLKGTLFRVAIIQAALPQGIVPFVFAREYNVHPDILSTGVIIGLLIAIPIALAYYSLAPC
ncbi:hypothetical protein RJ639_018872 [Escallonia herrerae]|uniref:Auxin efflux carrier component n=1 Tax=Escallonia herrerae TaxID=1293975 RepID=A0AA89AKA6_9ASTE|nr:hypothetical protein RJ639_018872 [Escallonia herrerae]